MTYCFIFCEKCGNLCDIKYGDSYEEIYVCDIHGRVEGKASEKWLCYGCEYFDVPFPSLDGYCDCYPGMSFEMFKRRKKCLYFELRDD